MVLLELEIDRDRAASAFQFQSVSVCFSFSFIFIQLVLDHDDTRKSYVISFEETLDQHVEVVWHLRSR